MRDAGRIKVDRGLGFCNGQNDRLVLKKFAHGRFEGGFSAPGAVRECSERAFVAERNRKKARGAVVNACCKFGGRKRLIVRRRGEKLRRERRISPAGRINPGGVRRFRGEGPENFGKGPSERREAPAKHRRDRSCFRRGLLCAGRRIGRGFKSEGRERGGLAPVVLPGEAGRPGCPVEDLCGVLHEDVRFPRRLKASDFKDFPAAFLLPL